MVCGGALADNRFAIGKSHFRPKCINVNTPQKLNEECGSQPGSRWRHFQTGASLYSAFVLQCIALHCSCSQLASVKTTTNSIDVLHCKSQCCQSSNQKLRPEAATRSGDQKWRPEAAVESPERASDLAIGLNDLNCRCSSNSENDRNGQQLSSIDLLI